MIELAVTPFRAFFAALALSFFLLPVGAAQAKGTQEIDANVDAALKSFKKDVKGAEEYLAAARGVLVMPDVKKVGFVVGAQWGEGALRVGGKTVDYYKMDAGSAGFQAGYQKASFVFLFLTQEALDSFRASSGWGGGVEAGITVVDASTPNVSADTLKAKSSVVAFAFGKEGLMGGWSAKGTKFTKLKK
jgi:lipid-binding SYLF domain-containing protein